MTIPTEAVTVFLAIEPFFASRPQKLKKSFGGTSEGFSLTAREFFAKLYLEAEKICVKRF